MVGGRPKKFDPETALDRAMEVFWRQGFEGTSITDLTDAMGINRPSLYATFGDKAALFRKALDRYVEVRASHLSVALKQPTAREVVRTLWEDVISVSSDDRTPRGCLLVQGALACSEANHEMRRAAEMARAAAEVALRERFEQAIAEGDLPASTNAADLALFVTTFTFGIAVQSAGGVSGMRLAAAAAIASQAFPSASGDRVSS